MQSHEAVTDGLRADVEDTVSQQRYLRITQLCRGIYGRAEVGEGETEETILKTERIQNCSWILIGCFIYLVLQSYEGIQT